MQEFCGFVGSESDLCLELQDIEVGPVAGGDIEGAAETGVKVLKHICQMNIRNSFQKYEDNFLANSIFRFGSAGEKLSLRGIREPSIKLLLVDGDQTCPISK